MLNIFLTSIIVYSICLVIKTNKSLQMLQQNRYNRGNKYLKWVKDNIKKNFVTIELIIICIPFLRFSNRIILPLVFNSLYFIISLVLDRRNIKENTKLPLKFTSRIIRLYITMIILYSLPIVFISLKFNEEYMITYYSVLALLAYFNNMIVVIANIINIW